MVLIDIEDKDLFRLSDIAYCNKQEGLERLEVDKRQISNTQKIRIESIEGSVFRVILNRTTEHRPISREQAARAGNREQGI